MAPFTGCSSASFAPQDSEDPVRFRLVLPVAVLAAVTASVGASDTLIRTNRTGLDAPRPERPWLAAEPGPVLVEPGDPAPDFSYQAGTGEWIKLRQLLEHGSLLLVFEPGEPDLRRMEDERESLLGVGVTPVAVLNRSTRAADKLARRLGLGFTVIADTQGAIASQYNLLGPPTLETHAAWFVVDRSGRVRALDRGRLPETGYMQLACTALQIAAPGATVTTSDGVR